MRHNSTSEKNYIHTPVMWREILEFVGGASEIGERIFMDCTLGEGGHSELLLRNFKDISIVGVERDPEILELAKKRLSEFKDRVIFINDNFSNLSMYTEEYQNKVSAFIYDFGISSYHYERSGRGFSINKDESLDMRLDGRGKLSAGFIINNYSEKDLQDLIWRFGEERWSKRIAKIICERRREKKIESSGELAEIVYKAIPAKYRVKNIHPATRVFQAIRIAVNDELSAIEESLDAAYKMLAPGGILIAISYHSLEDRIVKNKFRRLAKGCTCSEEPMHCQCQDKSFVKVLTKKPLIPKDDEIRSNRRARSAKLRVCKRLQDRDQKLSR